MYRIFIIEDDFSLYPEYEPFFFKAKEEKKHLLSQKEEEMSAAITSYGSSAFENLQSSLTATIATDEFTLNELRSRAEDGSRSVRKESYEEEIRLLEKNEIAFSYALNGVKGAALYLDKKRNWKRDLLIRESGSPYIKVMPSSSNKLPQAMPITNKPIRIKMFWRRRWFSLNSTKMPTPAETSKPDNIAPVPSMPSR